MGKKQMHTRVNCIGWLWNKKLKLEYGFDVYGNFDTPMTEKQVCNECVMEYHKDTITKKELSSLLIKMFGSKKSVLEEVEYIICCTKGCGNCIYIAHNNLSTRRFCEKWLSSEKCESDFLIGSAWHNC